MNKSLICLIFLSTYGWAIVGNLVDYKNPNVCEVGVFFEGGKLKVGSAIRLDNSTLLTAKHLDPNNLIDGIEKKVLHIKVICPGEDLRVVRFDKSHDDVDLSVFRVHPPFEKQVPEFRYPNNEKEEYRLSQSGNCVAWGYGKDKNGKSGALLGARVEFITRNKVVKSGLPSRERTTFRNTVVHVPSKEEMYTKTSNNNKVASEYWFKPWMYLKKGLFDSMPGDSGGPIFCKDKDGRDVLMGVIAGSGGRLIYGHEKVAVVPAKSFKRWIKKTQKELINSSVTEVFFNEPQKTKGH